MLVRRRVQTAFTALRGHLSHNSSQPQRRAHCARNQPANQASDGVRQHAGNVESPAFLAGDLNHAFSHVPQLSSVARLDAETSESYENSRAHNWTTNSIGHKLARHPLLKQRDFIHSSAHYHHEEGLAVQASMRAPSRAAVSLRTPRSVRVESHPARAPPAHARAVGYVCA